SNSCPDSCAARKKTLRKVPPHAIMDVVKREKKRKEETGMSYKDEWLVIEANDDIDETEHREPSEELLFYRAVANGEVDAVRKNCEQDRFMDTDGVGVLSKDPVTNLKYHFVDTTSMVTRMCRQYGMELEQAFRMIDFYIQKLDDIHSVEEIKHLHDE